MEAEQRVDLSPDSQGNEQQSVLSVYTFVYKQKVEKYTPKHTIHWSLAKPPLNGICFTLVHAMRWQSQTTAVPSTSTKHHPSSAPECGCLPLEPAPRASCAACAASPTVVCVPGPCAERNGTSGPAEGGHTVSTVALAAAVAGAGAMSTGTRAVVCQARGVAQGAQRDGAAVDAQWVRAAASSRPLPIAHCERRPVAGVSGCGRDAFEGRGPQRRPQQRLGRRLEEVAEAVGGGYCWLQMPLRLALGVRGTAAGRRLGALEGGQLPLFQCIPGTGTCFVVVTTAGGLTVVLGNIRGLRGGGCAGVTGPQAPLPGTSPRTADEPRELRRPPRPFPVRR